MKEYVEKYISGLNYFTWLLVFIVLKLILEFYFLITCIFKSIYLEQRIKMGQF